MNDHVIVAASHTSLQKDLSSKARGESEPVTVRMVK
jgi:hypothetical protein